MRKDPFLARHLSTMKIFSIAMALVLALGMAAPSGALAQPSTPFTATPLTPDSTYSLPKGLVVNSKGEASVIVKLKGDSLASYQGDIPGLAATSPIATGEDHLDVHSRASQDYLKHLDQKHTSFRSAASQVRGAKITRDYEVIMNSVAMQVPSEEVSALYKLPDVETVFPDQLMKLDTDNSPQFIGAPTVWKALGGQESSGDNVIVGVIDTGIWPEHPSFSDPDPSGKPYAPPPPTWHGTSCQFSGGANPGAAFTCNNKLIGAERFMATYDAFVGLGPGEYSSVRDDDGHGTHTASTAAGNAGVQASIFGVSRGTISGIAPRAHVVSYKVCGVQGCFSSDSAAAIEQSIADGVNVLNFSISGGANPYADAVELAFLDAYNAGIFVAASAGNSGPAANTTDHRGPWVTTVAASTQNRAFQNTITLTADGGASLALSGTSLTNGVGPAPLTIPSADPLCNSPFAPGSVAGLVVVCERGVTGRAEKGYNVLQGGAVGMILYNQSAAVTDLETDNHFLPASHIQFADGQTVLAFVAAHTNVKATLTAGIKVPAQGDVMASFSSRGGPSLSLGISKPDITAPGVQVLGGASPQHLTPAQGGVASGPEGELFQAIAGTSMSSPHIAGSGALIKALHPNWTPGQIKSALMTTAWTSVVKEDGVTPANSFDDGSGRVDLNKAGDPGLTFDESGANYIALQDQLWNANYPSVYIPVMPGIQSVKRTAHSVLNYTSVWKTSIAGAADFSVDVPPVLVVNAGRNAGLTILIDAKDVPVGQVRSATLYLTEVGKKNGHVLHLPITFVRSQPAVSMTKVCDPATLARRATTTCTITFQNQSTAAANVTFNDQLPLNLLLNAKSVTGGKADDNSVSFKGTLAGAQPPDVAIGTGTSPAGGYLPLSALGIGPIAGVGDDTMTNFNVPSFVFNGQTYSRLGVGSNGTIIVGGSTGAADATPLNQSFPNPTPPNNVIAPFWTDLNPGASGSVSIAVVGDGTNNWIVADWDAVREFSTANSNSFEVWIGINGVQDVSIAYGLIQGNGDGGLLSVGAENAFGNRGANYYFNGTGTLPADGTQLVVSGLAGVPGESHTVTYTATGFLPGKWVNYARLSSNLFQGVNVAPFAGQVTR